MQKQSLTVQGTSCSRRLVFTIVGFSLLLIAGIIFIFNSSGIFIVSHLLFNILSAFFAATGAICAFGQWIFPLPPMVSEKLRQSGTPQLTHMKTAPLPDMSVSEGSIKLPQDHEIRRRIEEDRNIKYEDYGALIVYVTEELNGRAVNLDFKKIYNAWGGSTQPETLTAYVGEYLVNRYKLFLAVFPRLDSGNYEVSMPFVSEKPITIFSSQIIELDVRKELRGW